MATRGRPKTGALTAAARKAAQRERDKRALWGSVVVDELTTSALVESLLGLIAEQRVATLGAVLTEIGRRGGVLVTARPSPLGPGQRVIS